MFMIIVIIKEKRGCEGSLAGVFVALFYPLAVPAGSIYLAAKELFWGKDEEDILTFMKGLKLFEHLGQYFLFSILF